MGLALAAVDFVDTYTRGLGQARVWAAHIAPTADLDLWLLQSLDLASVDLCWWPNEDNAWKTPESIVSIATVKVGLRGVTTTF